MIILTIALTILYMAIGVAVLSASVLSVYKDVLDYLNLNDEESLVLRIYTAVLLAVGTIIWPIAWLVCWFIGDHCLAEL